MGRRYAAASTATEATAVRLSRAIGRPARGGARSPTARSRNRVARQV